MKFKLSAYTIYELGQRKRQEDSIYPSHNATKDDDRLFIVCDGMGGHSGGNIASAAVCEAMSTTLNTICSEPEGPFSEDDLRTALSAAYDSLDAKDDGSEKKMGTTMTLLKFHDQGCTIAHIGDSRVYHVRPGADAASTEILFQTQDHSLVNDLVRIGELTPEEAKTSKQRNIITRAMQPNMGRRSRADIYHTSDIRPGDYFMLCTDGILEQMEDDNIKFIFSDKVASAQQKVDMIVKVTEENSDNHSAILVRVTDVEGAPAVAAEVESEPIHTAESVENMHESKNRRTQLAYILGMGAIVVATGLFFALRSPDEAPKGGEPSVDNVEEPSATKDTQPTYVPTADGTLINGTPTDQQGEGQLDGGQQGGDQLDGGQHGGDQLDEGQQGGDQLNEGQQGGDQLDGGQQGSNQQGNDLNGKDSNSEDSNKAKLEQEDPKQEDPKQEESKQEEPKQEGPKQEEPKQEGPKQEESKQDEPKPEEPKQEESTQEKPKSEGDGSLTQTPNPEQELKDTPENGQ